MVTAGLYRISAVCMLRPDLIGQDLVLTGWRLSLVNDTDFLQEYEVGAS